MKFSLILAGLGVVFCKLITNPRANNHKTLITRDEALAKRTPSTAEIPPMPEPLRATGNLTSISTFTSVINAGGATLMSSTFTTSSSTKANTDVSTPISSIFSASSSGAATSGSQSASVPASVETLWTALNAPPAPQPSSAESKSAVSTTTIISTIAIVPSTTSSQTAVAMYDQQFASWSKDNKGNFLEPGPTSAPAPTPSIRCSYDHIKHVGDGDLLHYNAKHLISYLVSTRQLNSDSYRFQHAEAAL